MADVPQDTLFSTTILPVLLTLAGVMFIFMMMNRQGGNAGSKAMNFGKSRAKLSTDSDKKVTFDHVAGLKEEKEELEEIVDFLKEPKNISRLERVSRKEFSLWDLREPERHCWPRQ